MSILLNAHPGRQHPISAPTMSVPMPAPGPFPAPASSRGRKQATGDKKNTAQNERYLSGISRFSI
ncbi:MAG TPA: hypothetical protein VF043_24060 [Ktedonobacteraceae bacterium]